VATTKGLTIYRTTTLVLQKMWAHGALKRIWLQLDSQHLKEIHNTCFKITMCHPETKRGLQKQTPHFCFLSPSDWPTYEHDATKQFYVGQQLNDQSEKYLKFNFRLRKP
jgi:hypothetical protein